MTVRTCHACGDRIEASNIVVCPHCGTYLASSWEDEADAGGASLTGTAPTAAADDYRAADASPVAFHLPGDDGTIQAALRDELARRETDWRSREDELAAARASHVEPVMRVLAEARAAARPVLVQLERNGLGTGVAGVSMHIDERPEGRIDARIAIALRRMRPERWETVGPTMADLRRDGVLRTFGWSIEVGVLASRSFALDPGDAASVSELVDALQRALDVADVPLSGAWQLSVAETEAAATSLSLDEAWVEDASAEQFRQRLVSLSRLRGGRVVVRFARNDHLMLEVAVRRESAGIRVSAKDAVGGGDTGGHWRQEWTQPDEFPGAAAIFADLIGVLAERLPAERSPIAVRIEERPAEFAWQRAKDTGWLAGWVVGLVLVGVPWALLTDIGHVDVLGALDRMVPGVNPRAAAALIVVPALSSMAFVFLTTGLAARQADARSLPYATGAWLIRIAAVIGSAVYVAALAVAGALWLPVAVAPAALLIVVGVVRLLLR